MVDLVSWRAGLACLSVWIGLGCGASQVRALDVLQAMPHLEVAIDGESVPPIDGCIPAGDGIDLAWAENRVYLIKGDAPWTPVWKANNAHIISTCYDGQYAWIAVIQNRKHALLIVLDPLTGEVWQITEEDGLPLGRETSNPNRYQSLMVAAAGPGCVCVCGGEISTWLALVTFDPPDATVNVFHRPDDVPDRENKEQWKSTTVAFSPSFMCTLESPPDLAGETARRVLVGRHSRNIETRDHPLVIDPKTLKVDIHLDKVSSQGAGQEMDVADGALYFVRPAGQGRFQLCRIRYPGLRSEVLMDDAREGRVRVHGAHVHFFGPSWWSWRPGDEMPRLIMGKPWLYSPPFAINSDDVVWNKPRRVDPRDAWFIAAFRTQRLGLLVATFKPGPGAQFHRVALPPGW